jgi:undecaprenyl-diphosphatase
MTRGNIANYGYLKDMTLGEAILYGAVQGITEYLPISSSAHLILLPRFLGTEDPGLSFDVFLHAGTLAATLIYFWQDWREVLAGVPFIGPWVERRSRPRRHDSPPRDSWKYLAIGTVPALIAGVLVHKLAEEQLRGNAILVTTLSVGGLALWLVDRFQKGGQPIRSLNQRMAVGVGLMQCLALIPGMSRSGSTMMGGRFMGLDRAAAARFSFLLSAPVTAAALVFELRKWELLTSEAIGWAPLLAGALSAFAFGWFAIDGLLRIVQKVGYLGFAIYRVALAIVIALYLGL